MSMRAKVSVEEKMVCIKSYSSAAAKRDFVFFLATVSPRPADSRVSLVRAFAPAAKIALGDGYLDNTARDAFLLTLGKSGKYCGNICRSWFFKRQIYECEFYLEKCKSKAKMSVLDTVMR